MVDNSVMVCEHSVFRMGTAPYRVVGFWAPPPRALAETNSAAFNKAVSERPDCCNFSCDHCGTPIDNHYIIEDAVGKWFAVGCDCVFKTHNVKLISAVKAKKNAIARERARERRNAKRAEAARKAIAEREAIESAEREANGGKTDAELRFEAAEKLRIERSAKIAEIAAELLAALDWKKNDFMDSLARSVRGGDMPRGRGLHICVETLASYKCGGKRSNSKAYKEAYDYAWVVVGDIENAFGNI
ncbi:MAG: hypothetical protein BV459_00525 [Thermoplasmata archaeon M11B2D]|nr:MAG: hypothetical protein BV459_00525 [Thermoplasmata archaeon M11B2D]